MKDKFKVGDVVTWGLKRIAHRVVKVEDFGVVVDTTSSGFGVLQEDGTRHVGVLFERPPYPLDQLYMNYEPEHTDMEPDSGPWAKAKASA